MYTVTLIAQKGGTGKTTLAINLAVAAEALGLRTALVDQDCPEARWPTVHLRGAVGRARGPGPLGLPLHHRAKGTFRETSSQTVSGAPEDRRRLQNPSMSFPGAWTRPKTPDLAFQLVWEAPRICQELENGRFLRPDRLFFGRRAGKTHAPAAARSRRGTALPDDQVTPASNSAATVRSDASPASACRSREGSSPRVRGTVRVFSKIGIGGSLATPPLPHHRTYGSVYGGSTG